LAYKIPSEYLSGREIKVHKNPYQGIVLATGNRHLPNTSQKRHPLPKITYSVYTKSIKYWARKGYGLA
jgi:hypothetical protein